MVQPAYEEADDETLIAGCLGAAPGAIEALVARHGILAELAVLRELEEGTPRDLSAWLVQRLRADVASPGATLGGFVPGQSTLRAYLAVVARHKARPEKGPRRRGLVSPLPTPGPIDLAAARESLSATSLMQAAKEALLRQPPNVVSIVRMRFHGLSESHIAALLGTSEAQAAGALERLAARLGSLETEMQSQHLEGEHDDLTQAFRVLLGASPPAERVRFARRTESERPLARLRAQVDMAYRWLKDSQLGLTSELGPHCLSAASVAGYVDGTMRGAARARAEGHVSGCASCLDEIASLSCDLRALPLVRDAQAADRSAQIAAMAIGVACFDAGTTLAESVAARRDHKSARLAADLGRLGRACRVLQGGASHDREMSGLVQRDVPSDDEAPLVAFESLALGDSGAAFRAIDEANAPAPVAARVRVLAAAAGGDAPLGHAWARAVKDGYDVDPGAVEDAECVLAIGEGEALPREIVVERLRALVPDLVRVVLAMHARPTR